MRPARIESLTRDVNGSALTRRALLVAAIAGACLIGCSKPAPPDDAPIPPPPAMDDLRGGSVEAPATPELE